MNNILIYPHEKLRRRSSAIEQVDRHLYKLIKAVKKQLVDKNVGVGLAAPQLGINQRLFAIYLPVDKQAEELQLHIFINAQITAQAVELTLGEGKKPDLEGCLSVPKIYAAVWRPKWLEMKFQTLSPAGELISHQQRYSGFTARVIAHEYDHLEGVLFIDHALSQQQSLFKENSRGELDPLSREELIAEFGN